MAYEIEPYKDVTHWVTWGLGIKELSGNPHLGKLVNWTDSSALNISKL